MSNNVMRWKIKKLKKQQLRLKKQLKRYPENAAAINLQIESLKSINADAALLLASL